MPTEIRSYTGLEIDDPDINSRVDSSDLPDQGDRARQEMMINQRQLSL